MADRLNTKSSDLSTGLRQKMNIVRGFLTDPQVLFLDEPTLGLDVGAARDVRQFIRQWVDLDTNRSLLLTTHYMVEADELCDRVAIINGGKVLACDQPDRLKQKLQGDAIFRLEVSQLNDLGIDTLESIAGVKQLIHRERDDCAVLEFVLEDEGVLGGVINKLSANDIQILNFQKREPTLEDVFVNLVGSSMAEVEKGD
jgi:ABC-2 type transport system ATP-binding protein